MRLPDHIPATLELPFDIWGYISQFLTDEQLKAMYSVNRAFFHIAMKLRYHEISIREVFGPRSSGAEQCYLMSVEFPESSRYVRSLVVEPVRFNLLTPDSSALSHDCEPSPPTERLITGVKRYFLRSLNEGQAQVRQLEIVHRIRRFVGALDHLTDLTIECRGTTSVEPDKTSLTLLSSAWGMFSRNLCHLALKGDIRGWKMLPVLSLHLENLESLRIELVTFAVAEAPLAQAILVPFIKRHSGTLRALILRSCYSTSLAMIYGEIGHLPRLRQFETHESIPTVPSHNPALHHFLSQHLDSLIHFTWGAHNRPRPIMGLGPYPDPPFNQAPFTITLPHITSLSFSLWGFPQSDHFGNFTAYISRHKTTLTSLSLDGLSFNSENFNSLVNDLASPALKQLDISVQRLTSSTFQTLATKLPGLNVLKLTYQGIGPPAQPLSLPSLDDWTRVIPVWEHQANSLAQEMEGLVLADWPVNTFHLKRSGSRGLFDYQVKLVSKTVLRSMPRVGFINGKYREDLL